MSQKPVDSGALESRLAEFGARNRDNPATRALLEQLSDLVGQSMPRNMKRLAPILERMEQIASADPAAMGDPTYRQIEEMHFGKPGQVPKVYFETAARDFVARTGGDNPQPRKAARKAIIVDLMARYSVTEDYAKRRLGEAINAIGHNAEKPAK